MNFLLSVASTNENNPGATFSVILLLLLILFIWAFVMLLSIGISILMYILEGFGINRMAKKLGVSKSGGAFAPIYRFKILGDTADAAAVRDGKKCMGLGRLLFWLEVGIYSSTAVIYIFYVVFVILNALSGNAGTNSLLAGTAIFALLIPACILIIIAELTFSVFRYIALYRVFECFSPDLAVLWLLLVIFVSFAEPILLLVLSKNQPEPFKFKYTNTANT